LAAVIKGIGVVGGFGTGLANLEKALVQNGTPAGKVALETAAGAVDVPALLADTSTLERYVNRGSLRRVDHYIRMALLGSYLALEDAGLRRGERGRTGIIVATGYGATCNTFDFQHSMINADDPCGSPTKFSNSVHNAAAAHISIFLEELGPNLSVSHYDMSIPSAFLCALQWLQEDRVDTVIIGGVDEFCKVLGYYWHCMYKDTAGRPAGGGTRHRIIGEGACFFVLANAVGTGSAYGRLEAVQMGSYRRERMALPGDATFFLGADGFSECEPHYVEVVPAGAAAANYTHLYGAIPVGTAFDVAIAALSIKSGWLQPPAVDTVFGAHSGNIIRNARPLTGERRICCLKLGADGGYGWISLTAAGPPPAR
jgi:3-oxoacyl-[acyl-carrier-protein] synthase II